LGDGGRGVSCRAGRGGVGRGGVGRGGVGRGGVGRGSVGRGSVSRGRVGRSRVGWGGVGSSFVFGVLGFAFVLDISDVSIAVSLVGHDLSTAIRKYNAVTAGSNFAIAALGVRVVAAVVIIDDPVEGVWLRGLANTKFLKLISMDKQKSIGLTEFSLVS
jgi:hypothetical protein